MFVVIGIAAFIGMALQTATFEIAGERYSRRLRSRLFRQYMKQEAGYFDQDENHTGSLTAKLAVDARNVNELITKVWGDIFQVIVTSVVGKKRIYIYFYMMTHFYPFFYRSCYCICSLMGSHTCCSLLCSLHHCCHFL
jgi:ATP-binding cassette subfamily B (MDR/TAP) protein 1